MPILVLFHTGEGIGFGILASRVFQSDNWGASGISELISITTRADTDFTKSDTRCSHAWTQSNNVWNRSSQTAIFTSSIIGWSDLKSWACFLKNNGHISHKFPPWDRSSVNAGFFTTKYSSNKYTHSSGGTILIPRSAKQLGRFSSVLASFQSTLSIELGYFVDAKFIYTFSSARAHLSFDW